MLRYDRQTKPGLVALYPARKRSTERVRSYNPGARTGHQKAQMQVHIYVELAKNTRTHTNVN